MALTIGGSMAHDRVNHAAVVTVTGGGAITLGNRYGLGITRVKVIPGVSYDTFYAHSDHLGTLRAESDVMAAFNTYPVHTAFGEDMTNLGQRHSYVGAFGYQSNTNFTALHVGARYYDPNSGRFLQRDPIGISGGINVYAYVRSAPTRIVDPSGLRIGDLDSGLKHDMAVAAFAKSPPSPPKTSQTIQEMQDELRKENIISMACIWGIFGALGGGITGIIVGGARALVGGGVGGAVTGVGGGAVGSALVP